MTTVSLHGNLFLGPYEGYHGQATYDADAETFHGRIVDTKDVITFEGNDPKELLLAFKESIDDYLEFCKERGESPEKPFSGKFMVRIPPKLHHDLTVAAANSNQSINQYVCKVLETAISLKNVEASLQHSGFAINFPQNISWPQGDIQFMWSPSGPTTLLSTATQENVWSKRQGLIAKTG